MVSGPKNTCNWNLKFIDEIGLKINVKIKLEQILGSTVSHCNHHIRKYIVFITHISTKYLKYFMQNLNPPQNSVLDSSTFVNGLKHDCLAS